MENYQQTSGAVFLSHYLNLQIKSLDIPTPVPVLTDEGYTGVRISQEHRTKKVFVFADDCNI
jgi:hypothetical protein